MHLTQAFHGDWLFIEAHDPSLAMLLAVEPKHLTFFWVRSFSPG
jgi:hypothetical protein